MYSLTSSERTSCQPSRSRKASRSSRAAAAAAHRLDRAAHIAVADRLDPALPALGRKVEDDLAVADRDVLAEDRGDAVALVRFRVELAADPEEAQVEEADGAGEGPLAGHPLPRQVARCGAAQPRQGGRELTRRLELARRRPPLPGLVVEVLLAARGVDPGRLDVAEGVGADPDLLPGGRNRQLADPLQRLLVVDPAALGVDVGEAPPAAGARDARRGAVGAFQPPAARQARGSPPRREADLRSDRDRRRAAGRPRRAEGRSSGSGRRSTTRRRRRPTTASVPYPKLIAALVVEGAVFRLTKGLVDHAVRKRLRARDRTLAGRGACVRSCLHVPAPLPG